MWLQCGEEAKTREKTSGKEGRRRDFQKDVKDGGTSPTAQHLEMLGKLHQRYFNEALNVQAGEGNLQSKDPPNEERLGSKNAKMTLKGAASIMALAHLFDMGS